MKGNIIICGAPRAGSTSIFRYLSSHRDIAPSYKKELNYFIGGTLYTDSYCDTARFVDKYIENFPRRSNKKWTMEASPAYMHPCYLPQVASRIKEIAPDARLIMMIRHPIDRLYSEFKGRKERREQFPESYSFTDFIDMLLQKDIPLYHGIDSESSHLVSEALMVSAYANTINQYMKYFDAGQLKLIFMESLANNPERVMTEVCEWLDISSDIYRDYSFHVENKMVVTNNKKLYRFALQLNRALDPVLSKIPKLRELMRTVHKTINVKEKSPEVQLDAVAMADINQFFLPYNLKLTALIRKHWPELDMPAWLGR